MSPRTEFHMNRIRAAIPATTMLIGVGLALLGVTIRPHSNPEIHVQIVVWSFVLGGFALIGIGILLVMRQKSRQ